MDLNKAVDLAKSLLGDQYFKNRNIEYRQDDKIQGLSVIKKQNEIKIIYQNKNDLFRALTVIKEKDALDSYQISLKPAFDTVGMMIDCSRNGVVKVDELKKIILIQALMGHNRLLLYTEDTYELTEYPYFGYLRGGYSEADLKEIVTYGNDFGVELVPCIQTLGHLERPLRWDVFDDVRENLSNLMVDEEKTYQFIETMIRTCRECFTSQAIHIGMDESFELGTGKYLNKFGYHDRVELFCRHLKRVIDICHKYDFSPMIWSDMFFRLNDSNQDYYSGHKLPKSTIDLIPDGIELVYWDYYHDDIKIYDNMFANHQETKHPVHFAGGAWRWGGFATSLHKSYLFNDLALKSAKKHQIKNVFVTSWGDNGNECSVYSVLLSLAQYSVANYWDNYTDADVDSLLVAVTGETKERMLLLDLPNMPDSKVMAAPYNPCKFFFYQDVLLGLFDKQVKPQYVQNYQRYIPILEKAAKESLYYGYIYQNLANLCAVLTIKTDLGVRLRQAYKANNRETLKVIANNDIPELLKRLSIFHDSLETQWNKENRRFGFDILDGRIGYLKARIASAAKIVNAYLSGKEKQIEELEKEILPYNGYDYEVCWNDWSKNVAV